ncbi:Hypothetical protein QR46_1098 [Giardia duodenalis assemblage B]|uniref:Uncharacterized protein n=1 Tax=Giardia duodenalis assemblage B TaxID=1394984 RepID=A0A132NXT8_GIAIN|nr:Hypothetical protein QR46_1098 [Giardia intestinalis assemblage B]
MSCSMVRTGQTPAAYFWSHIPRAYQQLALFTRIQRQCSSTRSDPSVKSSRAGPNAIFGNLYHYGSVHEPYSKHTLPRYFLYCIESPFCLHTGGLPM